MLRQKAGARLYKTRLEPRAGFDCDPGTDCVAVALLAGEAKGDCWWKLWNHIFQETQLRGVAILQDRFHAAVAVEIRKSHGAAVFQKIHGRGSGNIREGAIAVVEIEQISFVATPSGIRANQFVDGIPALLIRGAWGGTQGRLRHDLAPEKAVEIILERPGNHAIGDVNFGKAVMVQVPGVAGPGPTAH